MLIARLTAWLSGFWPCNFASYPIDHMGDNFEWANMANFDTAQYEAKTWLLVHNAGSRCSASLLLTSSDLLTSVSMPSIFKHNMLIFIRLDWRPEPVHLSSQQFWLMCVCLQVQISAFCCLNDFRMILTCPFTCARNMNTSLHDSSLTRLII